MTDVYQFSQTQLMFFFLLLMRMSAFVVSWPVFGTEKVSVQLKILFALILSMVLFPTLKLTPEQAAAINVSLVPLILREIFIGLALGYLARMFFFAFEIAGQLISQSMELEAAEMFNPELGGQSTSLTQFYVALASLFYLAINGHHYFILALVGSLKVAPLAHMGLNTSQFGNITLLGQEVLEIGLKLSAPVVISMLVINFVLGIVGKTVPQLNVLVTSFPINILVGFVLMIITLPLVMDHMGGFLQLSATQVFEAVKTF